MICAKRCHSGTNFFIYTFGEIHALNANKEFVKALVTKVFCKWDNMKLWYSIFFFTGKDEFKRKYVTCHNEMGHKKSHTLSEEAIWD